MSRWMSAGRRGVGSAAVRVVAACAVASGVGIGLSGGEGVVLAAPVQAAATTLPTTAGPTTVSVSPRDQAREERMAWWRAARFGMFIHWGVYSVPAGTFEGKRVAGIGEWIMLRGKIPVAKYKGFAKEFNPTKYDPEAWAELARDAGMKYVVITHKHHDGFAMFDSAASDWNVVKATPWGKDLIAPLARAVRRQGLKFGAYYSQAQDWTNPGGAKSGNKDWDPAQAGDYDAYLDRVAVPQVTEILEKFSPDILWWDTPINMTPARAAKFQPLLEALPMLITNDRLGGGEKGDLKTPEQHIPATGLDYDWETCMTMNDTWGYKAYDHNFKSVRDLLRKLSDIASKGGNFLLNVGPTAEGEIPAESVVRLRAMGRWMKANGEAIYGTTASPFRKLPWGRATVKVADGGATTLYLHVWDWPADGRLVVPGLRTLPTSGTVFESDRAVTATAVEDGVELRLPLTAPEADVSIVRLDFPAAPVVERIYPRPDPAGLLTLAPIDADLHNRLGAVAEVRGSGAGEYIDVPKPGSYVGYTVSVPAAGRYAVSAVLASASDGQKISLEPATVKEAVPLPVTGKLTDFKDVALGSVDLPAGVSTLSLRPVSEGWKGVRIRSVTLKPVN